jgi:hypothetical protein
MKKMPLTPEEKRVILATKAAKDARRLERVSKGLQITAQDRYDLNPIVVWKNVVESRIPIWHVLEEVYLDAISSVTKCDLKNKQSIEETLRDLNRISSIIWNSSADERKKHSLLENAVQLQSNSQVPPSEQLQSMMDVAQQPIPRPTQSRIDEIMGFYSSEKERFEQYLKVFCENEERAVPTDFVVLLDMIFPQPHLSLMQKKLLLCTIVKLLTGRLTLVEPTCDTARTVRDYVEMQLKNNRNIDGARAVLAKNCAESTAGCLDCKGIQARNVILHHTYMNPKACGKMLHSLLSGHGTALKAFEMYCEYWFGKEERSKQLVELLFEKHMVNIDSIMQKVGFSEEQRTEIVRLMLQKLDMTMEGVDSHISAFLANPTVLFP